MHDLGRIVRRDGGLSRRHGSRPIQPPKRGSKAWIVAATWLRAVTVVVFMDSCCTTAIASWCVAAIAPAKEWKVPMAFITVTVPRTIGIIFFHLFARMLEPIQVRRNNNFRRKRNWFHFKGTAYESRRRSRVKREADSLAEADGAHFIPWFFARVGHIEVLGTTRTPGTLAFRWMHLERLLEKRRAAGNGAGIFHRSAGRGRSDHRAGKPPGAWIG